MSWVNVLKQPRRVFHFICPIDLARHNNVYRVCYGPVDEPTRTWLPLSAFTSYESDFEAPAVDEGFDEVRAVNFKFEGSAEQRAKWDMWLLDK